MGLEAAVNAWNGRYNADLDAVYKQFFKQAAFVDELLMLSQQKQQRAAGVLLLRYLSEGGALTPVHKDRFFHVLALAKDAKTQLVWLQCLPFLRPVPEKHLAHLERFLLTGLQSKNASTQAWSMNGLYDLASDYPQFRAQAKQWMAENPGLLKRASSVADQQLMPFD